MTYLEREYFEGEPWVDMLTRVAQAPLVYTEDPISVSPYGVDHLNRPVDPLIQPMVPHTKGPNPNVYVLKGQIDCVNMPQDLKQGYTPFDQSSVIGSLSFLKNVAVGRDVYESFDGSPYEITINVNGSKIASMPFPDIVRQELFGLSYKVLGPFCDYFESDKPPLTQFELQVALSRQQAVLEELKARWLENDLRSWNWMTHVHFDSAALLDKAYYEVQFYF